jgi:hypothetical protein
MNAAPSTTRRKPLDFARGKLDRLRAMPPEEMFHRGITAAATWLDRATSTPSHPDAAALLARKAPALAPSGAALRALRGAMPERFFIGVGDPDTAAMVRTRMPEAHDEVLAHADRLLAGRFDLLGYDDLSFGDPIDWRQDAVWRRRAADVHWSKLDPLNHEHVGDSKVVWELNRHQWVARLAHAAVLSGDPRYAARAAGAIDEWLRDNPAGFGINWTSSLEVSYRLMSWCWTLMLLREQDVWTRDLLARVFASIWQHANHVRKHLSYYFSPNTHLTGEALGLVYAGTLFQEFRDARQWRDLGAHILLSQLEVQTTPDGVYFEQSTCYQRYTIDTYLQFLLLADRNGIAVPGSARERVARLAGFLAAVQHPDGSLPWIGDNDGGDALPLMPHKAKDARATLALAAAVLNRPDFAAAAGRPTPEVAWLCGPANRLRQGFGESQSALFPEGGYAVLRSGPEPDAHQMIVDVGPIGCPHSSGHGHADLLSVQCAVFGEPCVIDAGTYGYTAEPQWRAFFRGSMAHSVLSIDHRDQADTATPFGWHQRPSAHLNMWLSDTAFDYVDGWHDAYRRLDAPVVHRRRVVFVKPRYWVVIDDLYGSGDHDVDVHFQFAPLPIDVGADGRARARMTGGASLWVIPIPASPVTATLHCGEVNPPRGWISEDYGRRTAAPLLSYTARVPMPWRMVTFLMPAAAGSEAPPACPAVPVTETSLTIDDIVLPIREFHPGI